MAVRKFDVALYHRTEYRYERPVSLGPQVVQLRPAPYCRTPVLSYALTVTPAEHTILWHFDSLTNHVARVNIPAKTDLFVSEVDFVADLTPINPFAFVLEPGFEEFPFAYAPEMARNLAPFCASSITGPLLREFVASLAEGPKSTVSFLIGVNQRVCNEIRYTARMEHGVQTPEGTLLQRSGSCRDSSWLLVETCRALGLAARFVSGYLIQLADQDSPATGAGLKRDSVDLHAWAEVYLPGAGWIGFDPTSGLLTAEGHIPLAAAPTPLQAAPIGGTVEPAGVEFSYRMTVRRLHEEATLTEPYSDEVWAAVRGVAHAVDRELEKNEVRLTMGGEPTYVGIDEPESLQWNFEALGPIKRTRGLELLRALRERTAPGGLLHLGQGKWYPNEVLPRWAFHCISRADGVPVWENAALFAFEDHQYGFTEADALRFLQALTRRLQVSTESILPAFNPVFEPAYGAAEVPAGYVLPLRRRQPDGKLAWSSQLWFPRPLRLTLSPGDSPIGYRIPVGSMPFVAPDELVYAEEEIPGKDGAPTQRLVKLPEAPARHPEFFTVEAGPDTLPPEPPNPEAAPLLIRPALCLEAREGRLHVFLPFIPVLADYLDLVAAVEDTAEHLGTAIWIEGYPPTFDTRVRSFGLTPDPGVLEVNLPPTGNWDDLEAMNVILAEEAERHRLTPSKFSVEGNQLATGGGSHIVLGGATVMDSPILRRPDLLRSMIAFWQNHPSLSYLFSGMYVGPTSQYPRVDEARVDALYELELSFSHMPGNHCAPETLDGLFRNLLVDVTGNTHRAEFCIDKLYPPEGTGLRAGLLELRAFEMAPHVRMGLLQMLLVRALVALFWRQPFAGDLLRWGVTLHDRYMLPHFVEQDFGEVLDTLRRAGFTFEDSWFAPHLEYRFPVIGKLTGDGVTMELRTALEPWNVLAEETTASGTGRSVDSSLERLQVKLSGVTTAPRYLVTCNGRRIPLHATGKVGESVAGVRYRARRLNATLHPSIPVHFPLRFELIDVLTNRMVGGCTYFAGAPDGSLYPGRPVDADEARKRRLERFVIAPPSTETAIIPPEETNPVFPTTLDLRWPAPVVQSASNTHGLAAESASR